MNELSLWRHYFLNLPLFALGIRSERVLNADLRSGERYHAALGVAYLRGRLGEAFCPLPTEEIVRLAHLVRLVRESDTYASIRMHRGNMKQYFEIEGLQYLEEAERSGKSVALIGGHLGSNYTMWIALGFLGHPVYTIARAVDHSRATPVARQCYMLLTYWITSRKWPGQYLMADSTGHFPKAFLPKALDRVFERKGSCFLAIDFPPTLYAGKKETVIFLGGESRLPVNFIRMAVKRDVELLTVQDCVEFDGKRIIRRIRLGPPLTGQNEKEMLQDYANRLTELICREPWQWMGLQIASQYHG
ncbi:MAG: hypothetical protein V1844_03595 [Pseudomonadota bacterium]